MSKEKERCDCVISGRITQSEKAKMEEHGIKVRDAIQDKIAMMEDPHKLLRFRRNVLRNELRTLKYEMECKERELNEINEELGLDNDIKNHYNLDVFEAGNNIISRYKIKRGNSSLLIDDYLESNDGQKALYHQIAHYGGNNKEEFKNKLINHIKKHCDDDEI